MRGYNCHHWDLNHCSNETSDILMVTLVWEAIGTISLDAFLETWFLLKILFTATKKTLCTFSFRIQSQKWCHMDLALLWHRLTNIMTQVSFYLYFSLCQGGLHRTIVLVIDGCNSLWFYFWRIWKGKGHWLFPLGQTFHWNPLICLSPLHGLHQ